MKQKSFLTRETGSCHCRQDQGGLGNLLSLNRGVQQIPLSISLTLGRVSWSNPRKTWRVLFQRLLMPDSPTMTPEQGRAPLATSRKTDFPSNTQEAPWVPHHTSWENPQWRSSSRKTLPPSRRDGGLLFRPDLESNPWSSLQTLQEDCIHIHTRTLTKLPLLLWFFVISYSWFPRDLSALCFLNN